MDADARAERPRTRFRVIGVAVTAVLLALIALAVVVQVNANRSFDVAAAEQVDAADETAAAEDSLIAVADETADSVSAANLIVAVAGVDIADAGARTALADAAAAASAVVGSAESLLADDIEAEVGQKPLLPWELFEAADRMDATAGRLVDRSSDVNRTETDLETADTAVLAAGQSLYASVPTAAAAMEAANVSAVALVVLDFRDAAEAVAGQDVVASGAVTAFSTYAALAANLQRSAQSELDQKAGSLLDTRLEIEAYARSIAGGVVLDFDWAPLVNGLGGDWGLSGMATWNTARGGFSTITLSDSIAETWPSADSRAIVTHEVGHSITSKCSEMFDSQNSAANEEWATAWAISMGQTAEGNGVQAYGYPSQQMIDTAAGCR